MGQPSLQLAIFREPMPGMTCERGIALAQAAIVCLTHCGHEPGLMMQLTEKPDDWPYAGYPLFWWNENVDQLMATFADLEEATEEGACAIAIALLHRETGLVVSRRAKKGTGVDYVLQKPNCKLPFKDAVILEVSGILKEERADIKKRVKMKIEQTKQSDKSRNVPVFIVVVGFKKPQVFVAKRS